MVIEQVIYRPCDISGVRKVPLLETIQILLRQITFQQSLPLSVVPDMSFHQGNEQLCFLRISRHVFQGETVSFQAVFGSQYQHFIAVSVIKAEAVWHDMIYVYISRFKQPLRPQFCPGVQADLILIPEELELYQIRPVGRLPLISSICFISRSLAA